MSATGSRRAALALIAALALLAGCGDSGESGDAAEAVGVGPVVGGSTAQFASCRDWV